MGEQETGAARENRISFRDNSGMSVSDPLPPFHKKQPLSPTILKLFA